jgi:hypothetical protein
MNFLSYLGGIPASAKEAVDVITKGPAPTDLEIALARIHSDHTTAMVAIKLMSEAVMSNTTGNLNMALAQQGRQETLVTKLNEIKRAVTASDGKHFAAFELSQRPLQRAVEEIDKRITNKLNNIDADLHGLKVDRHDELDAHTYVLNQKLTLVAERVDRLCRIFIDGGLLKHPEGVTVAPAKKKPGRRLGDKSRTPEERYKFLSHRLQVAKPNSKARARYLFLLTELRQKMGMAPLSDRALGKDTK